MYKRKMWFGTGAVILFLTAFLFRSVRAIRAAESEQETVQRCDLCVHREDGHLTCFLCVELKNNVSVRIDSWEKEGEQWLFLPAVFRGQNICFEGKEFTLEEGPFVLECEDGANADLQILFGSEIPCAWLDTESGGISYLEESKENRESGSLSFLSADGTLEYAGELTKVKLRGNATRQQPKYPFRIGLEQRASLAGLGRSDDYVLLAEYGDISLMRNKAAMELANQTTELYEPCGMHIDLYLNGEYMGVYLLCEGISIGKNRLELLDLEQETGRVNSRELSEYEAFEEWLGEDLMAQGYEIPRNPSDITGGYLLELEYSGRYEGEETTGFRTSHDWTLVIKEPSHASREQVQYIQEQFQRAEDAMYAETFKTSEGLRLEEVVDLESLVHKYLIDEICMNTDLWTSQFLYKNEGEDPFHFGPVWDYDMAFGHYDMGFSSEEFYASGHIWYERVYQYEAFQELLKEEYESCYLPALEELTKTSIPEWKALLKDSARMNFTRWDVEEIYSRNAIIRTGDSFEECADSLRDFLDQRTAFLTAEWLEKQ